MRSGISQTTETKYLRPDEDQVAVNELRRFLDEHPASVARTEVTQPQRALLQVDPGVEGRQIDVELELDVRFAATDHGFAAVGREDLGRLAALVEERETRTRGAHVRADDFRLDGNALSHAVTAAPAEHVHAAFECAAALCARAFFDLFDDLGAAVRAKRLPRIDA